MRDREWWMRPALQKSEAILMPALHRRGPWESLLPDGFPAVAQRADAFQALPAAQTTALSTYVRPRGSMAGRGVLRAAGVMLDAYATRRTVTAQGRARQTWPGMATRQRETARRRALP